MALAFSISIWLEYKLFTFEKAQKISWAICVFLHDNDLATRKIANTIDDIGSDFRILDEDLTDLGQQLFGKPMKAYLRWVSGPHSNPDDTSLLTKALERLRHKVT